MLKLAFVALVLLFFGSVADIPVMFLAVRGMLPLGYILVVGFLADIIPDFFWYWLGQKIGLERFEKLPLFKQKPERLEAVGDALDSYGAYILFGSKFVYLFGIPAQIVAGAHHFPLKRAAVANALGSIGWLALLYVLARTFASVTIIKTYVHNAELTFTLFVVTALVMYGLVSWFYNSMVARSVKEHKENR
ncbi:MAG: hypothetical protein JWN50_725 [Parcubacteria group bacterium]|nr:hypothetical protein [Parcubacteria group bacterium]